MFQIAIELLFKVQIIYSLRLTCLLPPPPAQIQKKNCVISFNGHWVLQLNQDQTDVNFGNTHWGWSSCGMFEVRGFFFFLVVVGFVWVLFCGVLTFFFNGCMNALIGKLISEVMVLIECYSQPVRNLVCRLSELFEQFNTPPTKTNLNRLC